MPEVPGIVPVGEEVTIKLSNGRKFKARVTAKKVHVDSIDVTLGGLFPGGPPPDLYRKSVPGRASITLTVELGQEVPRKAKKTKAEPHVHRASCHGPVGELQCGYPACAS